MTNKAEVILAFKKRAALQGKTITQATAEKKYTELKNFLNEQAKIHPTTDINYLMAWLIKNTIQKTKGD